MGKRFVPTFKMVKNYFCARYFFKPAPLWLDFRTTNRCNQRCMYCGIPDQAVDELTTADIRNIIDKVKHVVSWILVTGGECLLRQDIGEIVEYIKATTNMLVTVNTNMFLLPEKFPEIQGADYLFFSIDGMEETHDAYRHPGSYAKVIAALEFLRGRRNSLRGLLSLTVLHKGTRRNDLEHVLWLADRYGFGANFQPVRHYSASKRSIEIGVFNAHGIELLEYLLQQKRAGRPITNSTRNLEILQNVARGINDLPCYSGRLFCYINSAGRVALCFSRPEDERYLSLKDEGVSFEMCLRRLAEVRADRRRCAGCTCTTPIEFAAFSVFDFRMIRETAATFRSRRLKPESSQ